MISPGVKVGPTKFKNRLQKSGARFCEVWFRVDKLEWYPDLFSYLNKHRINTGLHFWAVLKGELEPNIAYPGSTQEETIGLIRQAIDVAAKYNFHYVNIHCGNRCLVGVNLEKQIFTPDASNKISLHQAEATLEKSWLNLHRYSQQKNIQLLVETVPPRTGTGSLYNPNSRLKPINCLTVPVASLASLAKKHQLFVTNDFCHTFADEYDKPLEVLSQALVQKTIALAPYTKLIHINSVIPPYNGTDTHHGITEADYKLPGIFPSKEKLIELLTLFKNRKDVWAVNEPANRHITNFKVLKAILARL